MHVHVPQTGNQELACGVQDLRALRYQDSARFPQRSNASFRNYHGHVRLSWRAGGVNDCDMGKD